MTILQLVQILDTLARKHQKKIFSLNEIAGIARVTRPAAGMAIIRAQQKGILFRVGRLWVNHLNPPTLEEMALALVSPSYISFESALYHHGVLSQSPRGALVLATPRRPSQVKTPIGNVQFTHLKQSLFFGFNIERVAYPEKAWLDLVYIRSREDSNPEFPETWYLEKLNRKRLQSFAVHYPHWVKLRALRYLREITK